MSTQKKEKQLVQSSQEKSMKIGLMQGWDINTLGGRESLNGHISLLDTLGSTLLFSIYVLMVNDSHVCEISGGSHVMNSTISSED